MLRSSFTSMSIPSRMGLGFAGILVLLIAAALVSAVAMRDMGGQLKQIAEVNNLKTKLASGLMNHISELAIQARNSALFTDVAKIDDETKRMRATEKAYLLDEEALLRVVSQPGASSPEERALLAAIVLSAKTTLPLINQAAQYGSDGDNVSAVLTLASKVGPEEVVWRRKVASLIEMQEKLSAQAMAQAFSSQRQTLMTQAALVLASLFLGSLIAWLITRSVTRPIRRAVVVAERIAQGDLTSTIEVHASDETARLLLAMRAMQHQLRSLVGNIRNCAELIKTSSFDVAAGNDDLSSRTEQTAIHLLETSTSLSHLTDTVKQSSDSACQAQQRASNAAEVAAKGGAVVSQVITTMNDINASSHQIADIISVIDGIAFQTNILALNASVEASRAGEQGRGFAVVAGEVRILAGRSAEAAKQIKLLINKSVEKVEGGSRLVADAGQTMQEIVGSVQRVNDMIGEITAASTDQFEGLGKVNAAVSQLDRMTQQNSALVEQSAAAAAALKDQADRLGDMVGAFHLERNPTFSSVHTSAVEPIQ